MFASDCTFIASDPNPETLNQLINKDLSHEGLL